MFDQIPEVESTSEVGASEGVRKLVVVYCKPGRQGWAPIDHMVGLAGELLGGQVVCVDSHKPRPSKLLYPLLSRQRCETCPDLLLIAPSPQHLLLLSEQPDWRRGYNKVSAWIIDSFWTDRLPKFGLRGKFDHFYVTSGNDVEEIQSRTGIETSYLGFGADALRFGGMGIEPGNKDIDIFRIGRQPEAWDDDDTTASDCASLGLSFHGRPPYVGTPNEVVKSNADLMQRSKYILAHSNLADGSKYTHPDKEYFTPRWADALAAGAIVAGRAPHTDWFGKQELWPGALLDVHANDRMLGLGTLKEAAEMWTPELAIKNRKMALKNIDWRWRFKEIAQDLGLSAPKLDSELGQISRLVAS